MSNPAGETARPAAADEFQASLADLSTVKSRMDDLHRFLAASISRNQLLREVQMDAVKSEIASAIRQIISSGSSLLACTQSFTPAREFPAAALASPDLKSEEIEPYDETIGEDDAAEAGEDEGCEIVELDAVELLAEHVHFCEICGKGFKRDANLRMHMRAHGNQFKTLEALSKPAPHAAEPSSLLPPRVVRFSCPYSGCNRNKRSKKFKPLKSVICLRNHFKRSHCPKTYGCDRCCKKSFSVAADLKTHLKSCGETRWRCSCGTSFSRKDKLFGHMALFEGHMPAVADDDGKSKLAPPLAEDSGSGSLLDLDGLFNGFGSGDYLDGFGSSWNLLHIPEDYLES